MTYAEAIKWLLLQESRGIEWDDYSAETEQIRKEAEKRIREAYQIAITALINQEPRILTLNEVKRGDPKEDMEYLFPVFLERCDRNYIVSRLIDLYESENEYVIMSCGRNDWEEYRYEDYNKTWRCWSTEPTEEQRKAVKWDA